MERDNISDRTVVLCLYDGDTHGDRVCDKKWSQTAL